MPSTYSRDAPAQAASASPLGKGPVSRNFQGVIESWRDLVFAPGGERGDAAPPTAARVLNSLLALALLVGAVTLSLVKLNYNWGWESVWESRQILFAGWLMTVSVACVALVVSATLFGRIANTGVPLVRDPSVLRIFAV